MATNNLDNNKKNESNGCFLASVILVSIPILIFLSLLSGENLRLAD